MRRMLLACACGKEYLLKEPTWGRPAKCTQCSRVFHIPEPEADGRIASRKCPVCGQVVEIPDGVRTGKVTCPCNQELKIPFVSEVDGEQPLVEQFADAHRQLRQYLHETVSAHAAALDASASVAAETSAQAAPSPDPEAAAPDASQPPRQVTTSLSQGIAEFGGQPGLMAAPPTSAPGAVAKPASPEPESGPVSTISEAPPAVAPPLPVTTPPVVSAAPPRLPAGPAPTVGASVPPPQPEMFAPPPVPDTSAIPPAVPPSGDAVADGTMPPPMPTMPSLPPSAGPGLVARLKGELNGPRRTWIIGGASAAVILVVLLIVVSVVGSSPSRQLGLSADWSIETNDTPYQQTRALQIRLHLENKTSRPISIEPIMQDPFEVKDDPANEKPSMMERMAMRKMEEEMARDMRKMEEEMARNMGIALDDVPKYSFQLQAAIGSNENWRALNRMGWRAEIEGQRPDSGNIFFGGSGWTIPAKKTLTLVIDVANQSKPNPERSFGQPRTPQPGQDPGVFRVHAVRQPKNTHLSEFTSSPRNEILSEWTQPW